jgi:hemoglobin
MSMENSSHSVPFIPFPKIGAPALPPTFSESSTMDIDRLGADSPVVRPQMVNFFYPESAFPTRRVGEVAGFDMIRNLVLRHHELIWNSPLRPIFGEDEAHFLSAAERTARFHVEVCGGEKSYTRERGQPRLRSRHFPFTITEKDRELWLELYIQALVSVRFPREVIEEYWQWIESLSIRMINRRTTFDPPKRFPWESVRHRFEG